MARSERRGADGETPRKANGARRKEEERRPTPPFPVEPQERPGIEEKLTPKPFFEAPAYRAAGKLRGKVALVTGGDSGIGRAVAVLFAREGADVAITYLPVERVDAEKTRRAVEAEGRRALLLEGDLTEASFCEQAVERTVRELGRLDILVNNAAYQHHANRVEDISDEQWEHTFATNITAQFRLVKHALPHLRPGSAIINSSSITGLEGKKTLIDYSTTKGAINAFTKSLAQALVERGIRVNSVAPGPVWTPLNPADRPPEKVAHFGEDLPVGRPAQPEEVAPAYVFFASGADSGFVTGEVLTILGGRTTAA